MSVIKPLPSWVLVNRFPSFYDDESLTAIEQTGRVYGKINELIDSYNRFVTENKTELTELEAQVQKDIGWAIRTIMKLTDSYITQVELRLTHQDRKLGEQYKALTDNITGTIDDIIRQMKDAGELDQTILDAIDRLNTKFETLQSTVAEEQAALRADYEVVKNDLIYETSVQCGIIRTACNQGIERVEREAEAVNEELKAAVASNTEFRLNTSVTLAEFEAGADIVGVSVQAIMDYSLVGVQTSDGYCVCKVIKGDDKTLYIRGVGYAAAQYGNPTRIRIPSVNITITAEGVIGFVNAGSVQLSSLDELVTVYSNEITVTRIDGLVLNSGDIA